MAEITCQAVSIRKVALALRQAAVGDTAQVGNNKCLILDNDPTGATRTVTVAIPGNGPTGAAIPDLIETVAAGESAIIPLGNQYADSTTTPPGMAVITYDATPATFKVAVVALI